MSRAWGETIAAATWIGLSIYFAAIALEFPAGGGTFPLFSAGGTILLALLLIFRVWVKDRAAGREKIVFDFRYEKIKPMAVALLSVVYVVAIFEIGYFVSSILFLAIATYLVGIRNYRAVLLTGVVLFPLMYLFFVIFLQANLPRGLLY
ncbi:MAG: tripartite tricarboxylate transporter TctB family protein [bacterium]